ncbi:hypothetical protein EMPS_05187 [Entomortierella parvispora]|uniref:Uncharacterized protein n=1 Tax=Entomortierella parvispora TaxID=205924 RepID=A0A9P3H9Z7_9FUNG|nr:hypothetical protein EMPS_05187 [Entomortierella parvispora]
MVNADQILSIVAVVCFAVLLVQFALRYRRSGWGLYMYIAIFCVIRVVAYGIRAYIDGSPDINTTTLTNLTIAELICISIGAIFAFKLIARLYESILPKLRAQSQVGPDLFERTMVQQNKLFLLPLVILVILGAVDSTPGHTESQMSLGLTLRRVGVSLLMIIGIWYLYQGYVYRQRYSANGRAFTIALLTILIFDLSLVYKVIYSFWPQAETVTIVYFVLSPLLELIALAILSVDLQAYFLGHAIVQEDIEIAQPALAGSSQAGYYQLAPTPAYHPQQQAQQQMYNPPQYSSAQY